MGRDRREAGSTRPAIHLFSGPKETVVADVARLAAQLDSAGPVAAHRPRAGAAGSHVCRLAIVANGADDLRDKLAKALDRLGGRRDVFSFPQGIHGRRRCGRFSGKVAFMFPGQGSHRVGMVETVSRDYPGAWSWWEAADRVLAGRLPVPLSDCVFPHRCAGRRGADDDALAGTDVAQPAIGVADAVLNHVLVDLELRADMHVGHSYGEYAALYAAGCIGFRELVELSEARGRAIEQACGGADGAMLAVGAAEDRVARLCQGLHDVVVANVNGPEQTVVAGSTDEIGGLESRCERQGVRATRLKVRTAFHSPIMAPARDGLGTVLAEVAFRPGVVPVYANLTGEPHGPEPGVLRDALVEHLVSPVRFLDSVRNMYRDGARCFVEVGPGNTLASLASSVLRDADDAVTVAVDHPDGWFGLLNALARLFVAGVPWSAARLDERFAKVDGAEAQGRDRRAAEAAASTPPTAEVSARSAQPAFLDEAMERHHRLMKLFLESETRVMVEFLRGRTDQPPTTRPAEDPAPAERAMSGRPGAAPAADATTETASPDAEAEPKAGTDRATLASGPSDILTAMRDIVASLTGYPRDMLDPELDLEADLGIDSIKRVEILVAMRERSLLPPELAEDDMKALAKLSTLSRLSAYLTSAPTAARGARNDGDGPGDVGPETAPPPSGGRMDADTTGVPVRSLRTWQRVAAAERVDPRPRTGRVAVAGGDAEFVAGLAEALPDGLTPFVLDDTARGAVSEPLAGYVNVRVLHSPRPRPQDVFGADTAPDGLHRLVNELQALEGALRRSRGFVYVVARLGNAGAGTDALSAGSAGVVKSVALEWPEVECRVVDAGSRPEAPAVAAALADELRHEDFREVSLAGGVRRALLPVPAPLSRSGEALELDDGDLVLFTGGARGITAEVALAVAARWRVRLVVLGRTEIGVEEPRYRGLADMAALKHVIAGAIQESGRVPSPREVDRIYAGIVRRREAENNLRRLRECGAHVTYVCVDVADRAAFELALADTYRTFGRIDAVVHGAGVVEDRLIGGKTPESFDRVLRPKLDGALTLVRSLRLEQLKLLCFFSSTAAVYGNAGQADYAAANAMLNALARTLSDRVSGRAVAISWGPWEAGVGMVTSRMARRFAAKGVPVIARELGTKAFVDEVRFGPKADAEVILG